jgi:glycosyltransferase involved in cell wall biosynthesis
MIIIYPVPEIFPDHRARFIQIIKTCHALAERGAKVLLITGIRQRYSKREVLRFYGIPDHYNLRIIRLPILRRENKRYLRFSYHGIFHFFLLPYLLLQKLHKEQTVFFIRHIKLANFIMKYNYLLDIPLIFEVHEIFNLTTSNENKRDKLRSLEYKVYNKADAVISISKSLKEYLINMGTSQKKTHVIYNGVDKNWFDMPRTSYGSYICYIGSLYPWKGVDTLISAMKYLPDERLLIIGGGRRLGELKILADREGVSGRVTFIGTVSHDKVPEYLSDAKIAVLPNILNGPSQFSSPIKLFEYIASGVPIIASDIPVFKEILVDGKNAILFEPGNKQALAESIGKITHDLEQARRMAISARKNAENYTYQKRAEKIFEVINLVTVKKQEQGIRRYQN